MSHARDRNGARDLGTGRAKQARPLSPRGQPAPLALADGPAHRCALAAAQSVSRARLAQGLRRTAPAPRHVLELRENPEVPVVPPARLGRMADGKSERTVLNSNSQ